jgi:tetratricopeptide (TPR) repeat protein
MRANRLYESGSYEAARDEYEKLVNAGYRGASLYYNLGNAYFKLDRKGMAILFYEKALKLRPRDQDVRSNLEYARSLIEDRVEPRPQAWLVRRWTGMVGYFNLRELIGAAAAAYWLFAAALIALIYAPSWRRPLVRVAVTLTLALAVAVAGALSRAYLEGQEGGVVLSKEVKVHYGPSDKDVVAFVLHEGTVVEIENVKDDWYQVSLPDGKAGWVKREYCDVI